MQGQSCYNRGATPCSACMPYSQETPACSTLSAEVHLTPHPQPIIQQEQIPKSRSVSAHRPLAVTIIRRPTPAPLVPHAHLHRGGATISPGASVAALLAVKVATLLRRPSPVPLVVAHLVLLRLVPAQLLGQREHLRTCKHASVGTWAATKYTYCGMLCDLKQPFPGACSALQCLYSCTSLNTPSCCLMLSIFTHLNQLYAPHGFSERGAVSLRCSPGGDKRPAAARLSMMSKMPGCWHSDGHYLGMQKLIMLS